MFRVVLSSSNRVNISSADRKDVRSRQKSGGITIDKSVNQLFIIMYYQSNRANTEYLISPDLFLSMNFEPKLVVK